MKNKITFTINGEEVSTMVSPNERLLDVIRDRLHLKGTKEGCGYGECGACTVIIDGKAVNSCLYLAQNVDGRNVLTIEGLAGQNNELHPLQQAFLQEGAVQCGYCTPGTILSAKALLDENPAPNEKEIRTAIAGNLCRCTGYVKTIKAISAAARVLRKGAEKNETTT